MRGQVSDIEILNGAENFTAAVDHICNRKSRETT